jgi:hypothetical protein
VRVLLWNGRGEGVCDGVVCECGEIERMLMLHKGLLQGLS